jgi:hypothetical protein
VSLSLATVADLAVIAAGFVAVARLLTPIGRRLLRVEHEARTIRRVVIGTPEDDGQPAVPGVAEHLAAQDAHLAAQDAELAVIKSEVQALRGRGESEGD